MDAVIRPSSIRGTFGVPADKAICHRAAILCAVSQGDTQIAPWSPAEDCQRTVAVLQQLGVEIAPTPQGIRVHGVGLLGLQVPQSPLDCGESGTTMRLCAGLLAGQPFVSRLTAGPSLSRRPMRRIVEPLTRMGARLEGTQSASHDLCPPLVVAGTRPLHGLTYQLPVASAQVKSAILLAGLYAETETVVVEPIPTRDHTERLLEQLGVPIRREGHTIHLAPPQTPMQAPSRLVVPGDLSSAAFFITAAAVLPDAGVVIEDVSLNPTRMHFLNVLRRMGASIDWTIQDEGWEPRGTITVAHRPLRGTVVSAEEIPQLIDELPILMVAACVADGETRFEGLQELRVKETDRFHAMTTGLRQLGASLEPTGGAGLRVRRSRLRGAVVDSFADHRTAMSLAIAGLLAQGETQIRGVDCVAKSLGSFFELLASVTSPSVVTVC